MPYLRGVDMASCPLSPLPTLVKLQWDEDIDYGELM